MFVVSECTGLKLFYILNSRLDCSNRNKKPCVFYIWYLWTVLNNNRQSRKVMRLFINYYFSKKITVEVYYLQISSHILCEYIISIYCSNCWRYYLQLIRYSFLNVHGSEMVFWMDFWLCEKKIVSEIQTGKIGERWVDHYKYFGQKLGYKKGV